MRGEAPLRLVLVDDHRMFVEGLAMMLGRDHRVAVVGVASTPAEAMVLAKDVAPEVVLLDVDLHDQPADRTIRGLLRIEPRLCIVMLTMHTESALLDSLVHAGARACVNKILSANELVERVIALAAAPIDGRARPDRLPRSNRTLTAREREVLWLASTAKSNREIAEHLAISEGTVKRHLHEVNAKLEASTRLDAVRKAEMLGILGSGR